MAHALETHRNQPVERLLDDIESQAGLLAKRLGRPRISPRVLEAMRAVPRHEFVHPEDRTAAYEDRPLPIGYGQTVSQPFVVAVMVDSLDLQKSHRVLEIGTGCGYQTAILARLAGRVYSIEIIPELAWLAAERLSALQVRNVETRVGDGAEGWPEAAPFDAILVSAGVSRIPEPLLAQLGPLGRLVAPVGRGFFFPQDLLLVRRNPKGSLERLRLLPVMFVPLVHKPEARSLRQRSF